MRLTRSTCRWYNQAAAFLSPFIIAFIKASSDAGYCRVIFQVIHTYNCAKMYTKKGIYYEFLAFPLEHHRYSPYQGFRLPGCLVCCHLSDDPKRLTSQVVSLMPKRR